MLRTRLDAESAPGIRYAETTVCAPLGGGLLPRPQLGRVGLIAAWDDDTAFEGFLTDHQFAEWLDGGWHVRLEPLRAVGAWSGLPDLPDEEREVDDDDPVAVLTLGRLRLRRAPSFVRTSARAERDAMQDPGLLAATGLARPPRLVATFSLWRNTAAVRAYAHGENGDGHVSALRAHAAQPFHHESVFARFRPYAARGTWHGRDPLAPERLDTPPLAA